jgi:mRNA interferase MazF
MRGKVVLVPFPFDDLSTTKVRPAVCLAEPVGAHRHVVLAFVSSVLPSPLLPTDVLTGLRVRSVLRLHRMVTVATAIIRRDLGDLSTGRLQDIEQRLRLLFGI